MTQPTRVPAKTKQIFDILKKCASQMRTITYGEIAREVHLANEGVGKPLGYIRDTICRNRELPWLNSIAVNVYSDRPGESFIPGETNLNEADLELFWRGMVLQVFAFNWSHVDFEE